MLHVIPSIISKKTKRWDIYIGPETGQQSNDPVGTVTLGKKGFQIDFDGRHSLCNTFESAVAWLESTSRDKVAFYE